jgi:hypothetical protein
LTTTIFGINNLASQTLCACAPSRPGPAMDV